MKALLIGIALVTLFTTASFAGDACPDCPFIDCSECGGNGTDYVRYDVCGPGQAKCDRDALARDAWVKVETGLRRRDSLRVWHAPRCRSARVCSRIH
jgi:hypothetical protein